MVRNGSALVRALLLAVVWMTLSGAGSAGEGRGRDRVVLQSGVFLPLYGALPDRPVEIRSFRLDRYPVTNEEFSKFVAANPEYARGTLTPLFADAGYLAHWASDRDPSAHERAFPVVNVSWFAASEFCSWAGGRLPTVLEWEYAAAASSTKADASRDPEFVGKLLEWYGRPSGGSIRPVGQGTPNLWGVHDLHGLVWEWTEDFNSVFVSGDNRRDTIKDGNLFCGIGSFDATDRANYAAFLRYAMRSSLQGHYTTKNVGFRCAYDSGS